MTQDYKRLIEEQVRGGAPFMDVLDEEGDLVHLLVLNDAELRDIDLTGADMISTDLIGADLTNARLVGAKMHGGNYYRSIFDGADLSFVDVHKARFSHGSFVNTNFFHSEATRAEFPRANMQNTNFVEADIGSAFFFEVNLVAADFSYANCGGASFSCAAHFLAHRQYQQSHRRELFPCEHRVGVLRRCRPEWRDPNGRAHSQPQLAGGQKPRPSRRAVADRRGERRACRNAGHALGRGDRTALAAGTGGRGTLRLRGAASGGAIAAPTHCPPLP